MAGLNVTSNDTDAAKFNAKYHDSEQPVVLVPVMDIRDATSSAKEEVFQFSAGGFLASGSFWLGLERLLTVGWEDTIFICCIAFFICGAILAGVGYRQTLRRVTRLERYLPDDKS